MWMSLLTHNYVDAAEFVKLLPKLAVIFLACAVCGCATAPDPVPPHARVRYVVPSMTSTSSGAATSTRLAHLWMERSKQVSDFPIGPGDLLQVSVPGIKELTARTARVDGTGDIYLPLIGDLHVAGKTQGQVRSILDQRMNKFLYHPQTDLFIKEYSSRWVAVTGAVGRPGMYVLNGPGDTIRELIERAGGMSPKAAPRVLLTVGRSSIDHQVVAAPTTQSASLKPVGDIRTGNYPRYAVPLLQSPGSPAPLIINLAPTSGDSRYLSLPVRPGDTIYVPEAGSVTVIGWVYHPKAVPITPGLTVLGAVSACGGPLFAGDMRSVTIIRTHGTGTSSIFTLNLDSVQHHDAPGTQVQANDIVQVPYSTARLPGYALYYAATGIVSFTPAAVLAAVIP